MSAAACPATRSRGGLAVLSGALLLALGTTTRALASLPPWTDPNDVPLPAWVRSVEPKKDELPIFLEPGRTAVRRGTLPRGVRAPLFATQRGANCVGRWLNVGPLAWVCSDQTNLSEEPPQPTTAGTLSRDSADGLPYRYFFVGKEGAFAWDKLEATQDGQPDQEIDPGFGIAASEERAAFGERWVKTSKNRWVALRNLAPAHASSFSGEPIAEGERLDFGWIVVDKAIARAKPSASAKALSTHVRFERVPVREVRGSGPSAWARVSESGEAEAWMALRDLARPTMAPRPSELALSNDERWIDVELASQTLVAYEGERPVFATLVSTGRGAQGTDTATPIGISRIWVKLQTSTMDNLERREDPDAPPPRPAAGDDEEGEDHRYSLDDVPYVQFFNKAVALHGVFWHRNFGHVQSHGCVNLAPKDARFLFGFTGPHLPRGWSAVLPTDLEKGTLIRVR